MLVGEGENITVPSHFVIIKTNYDTSQKQAMKQAVQHYRKKVFGEPRYMVEKGLFSL